MIIISSCTLFKKTSHAEFVKEMVRVIEDPNTLSLSDNYHIYTTHKIFTYKVNQQIEDSTINFILKMTVLPSINESALIGYRYYYEDKIDSTINDSCKKFNAILADGRCYDEMSRIDESKTSIYVHPPRYFTLRILELCPFTSFFRDTSVGKSAVGLLHIPKNNWEEWEKTFIKNKSTLDSIVYTQNQIPEYYYFNAITKSRFGVNKANFVFNVDSGYTKMDYMITTPGYAGEIKMILTDISTL